MNTKKAVDWLDKSKWQKTSAQKKLRLLKEIRNNMTKFIEELAWFDTNMQKKLKCLAPLKIELGI